MLTPRIYFINIAVNLINFERINVKILLLFERVKVGNDPGKKFSLQKLKWEKPFRYLYQENIS